jgi:hypothetical protein
MRLALQIKSLQYWTNLKKLSLMRNGVSDKGGVTISGIRSGVTFNKRILRNC